MATITSAGTGNWSAGATWVGGVAPTSVDDVVITSTHIITADVDITVLSITSNASGQLLVNTARNITCTASGGITVNSTTASTQTTFVNITASSPNVVNITANITYQSLVVGGTTNPRAGVVINGTATINVIGNVITNVTQADSQAIVGHAIFINVTNAVLNVTGNVTGGLLATFLKHGICLVNSSGLVANITITGNCTARVGSAVSYNGSNYNGLIRASGTVTGSSSVAALIGCLPSLQVQAGGVITNTVAIPAISSPLVRLLSTVPTQWTFQTENALVNKTLYDTTSLPSLPAITDVRNAVSYANGTLTGTLVVPAANTVTLGVSFDNGTLGTAQNTAASFLTELAASSDPLAVRLKNVATVQTTGDQIAAAL